MADHPHTIDRWDDATGENLVEQIAAVGDYLVALETYRAAAKVGEGQDHAPEPDGGDRAELGGLGCRSLHRASPSRLRRRRRRQMWCHPLLQILLFARLQEAVHEIAQRALDRYRLFEQRGTLDCIELEICTFIDDVDCPLPKRGGFGRHLCAQDPRRSIRSSWRRDHIDGG